MSTSTKSIIALSAALVLGLLGIVFPNFIRARNTGAKNACINNLRQIEGAKEQWELENKRTTNDVRAETDLFGTDRYIKSKPICSAGGTYNLRKVGERPTCSIDGTQHSIPK